MRSTKRAGWNCTRILEYLRQGITSWIAGWKARGWRTLDRKPVKNADLWRKLDEARARHEVKWRWVKGHAGHRENERCDQLAGAEIAKLRQKYSASQLANYLEEFEGRRAPENQVRLL